MSDWQTIETAPTDGTLILAVCQPRHIEKGKPMTFNYITVVWWRGARREFKDSHWKWRHTLDDSAAEPTHWMPIPKAPAATT